MRIEHSIRRLIFSRMTPHVCIICWFVYKFSTHCHIMQLLMFNTMNLQLMALHSLVPRPFRRRKGLVHIASACAGGPQKKLGESDTIVYSPFIIHRTARHAKSVSDHHGNATGHYGDASACARNVYQALLSPPEGPGYEARHYTGLQVV